MEIDDNFKNNHDQDHDEGNEEGYNSFFKAKNKPKAKGGNKKPKGFRSFNIGENLLQSIKKIGYKFPTPIQRKVIPEILSGFNIIAHSRTGSGKTAAFLIPLLHKLKEHNKVVGARCLILSPTRELAHQTLNFCKKLGKFTNLRIALLVGGNELEGQFEKLAQNPDIIIATPGRIAHHLAEGSLKLKRVELVVVDEADKIFELNFSEQLTSILKSCPVNKQVSLFSATIPQQLAQFMKMGILKEYKLINIDEENKIPDKLKIHLMYTRPEEKQYALLSLFKNSKMINPYTQSTIVFVMTKYHCEYMHEFLKFWNVRSLYIYGQMDQELRDKNLETFRKGGVKILIVTDVAARGLDIPMLDNVVNYDFPDSIKLFIHRIGRTARSGNEGKVFNLVTSNDLAFFYDFKFSLGKKFSSEGGVDDFNVISFGAVPQFLINHLKEQRVDYLNNKTDIDSLQDSMRKAEGKANSFKAKPSKFGIKQAKKLLSEDKGSINYHPLYQVNVKLKEDEREKQEFLNKIKHFKPAESYFERVNETSVKEEVIKEFKHKADEYKRKKEIEKKKESFQKNQDDDDEMDDDEENQEGVHEVKEQRKSSKSDSQKLLNRKTKRSKIKNFKNNPQFIGDTKTNDKSLWGDEKPITLDELTLNIIPDDDNTKVKKTIWDKKKKNFVQTKVDKKGRVFNEAGVKIKKGDKNKNIYDAWKKKNKMKIQRIGELESDKVVESAKTIFSERKKSKFTSSSKGEKVKDEVKSSQQILKGKKEKFKTDQRKKFSKKSLREMQIKTKSHQNRRSQAFVKKRKK